ncbi:hypothetical protein HTZ77_00015 [Nonomuraea sp. SMC257]|uniref:DUF6881 domain-containing protein n=1 Tax=Nonomuraea montanisoli TaxID=2741721 RepID=A0A7Y6M0X7_9ACTN|nr:hypothetical protein [Nonomuraea montanisoli]NUW29821.1 hypothetical protein [Nonomuraea montanisoli]
MRYLKVIWRHDFDDYPVELYSELDNEGYEVRKVEIYRSGRRDYADFAKSTGQTGLGEIPVPSIEEIAEQEEFTPAWINADEFERVWDLAVLES